MTTAGISLRGTLATSLALMLAAPLVGLAQSAPARAEVKYNWLDFGGNPQHDNFDRHEEILTKANVGRLKPLWSVNVGGMVDREPLYVHDLNTIAGKKDVVFVNTMQAQCAAFDALTGAKIWMTHSLNSKEGARGSEANCVIDPTLQYIFVYGTDGYVYKLKTYDGSQVTDGGWPIQAHPSPKEMGYSLGIFTAKNGVTYLTAKNSQGLGHIVTLNLKDNTRHVFTQGNTTIVDQIVSRTGHRSKGCKSDITLGFDFKSSSTDSWSVVGVITSPAKKKPARAGADMKNPSLRLLRTFDSLLALPRTIHALRTLVHLQGRV